MNNTISTDLGAVTAYADARAHGYKGTREDFGKLLGSASQILAAANSAKEAAEQSATNAKASEDSVQRNADASETNANIAKTSAETATAAAKEAQQVSQGAVGWYEDEEKLNAAHPTAKNGNWAIVGTTDTIWVWDSDTNKWRDSGSSIEIANYYTKDEVTNLIKTALDSYCPFAIGQIYISMTDANPAAKWTGTEWTQIKDCFLRAADDTVAAGSTGGAWTHSMSVSEMAKHSHDLLLANPEAEDAGNPYVITFAQQKRLAVYSSNSTLSAGSGKPMNIVNKYTAVYMWQRTK